MISKADLIALVEDASSLPERLGPQFIPVNPEPMGDPLVKTRLERWCQLSAQGNWDKFQKRLQWDDLSLEGILPKLGSVKLADPHLLPEWALLLQSILNQDFESIVLPAGDPVPFQEIYLPFLAYAQHQLSHQVGQHCEQLLSKSAQGSLYHHLLKKLSSLGSDVLAFEFSIYRSFQESPLSRKIRQLKGEVTTEQYQEFIRQQQDHHLLGLFEKYPVLAKLLTIRTQNWIDATVEFVERLAADLENLQGKFPTLSDKVENLVTGLSDSHHKERSVIFLAFESGGQLIYKPRSLNLEVAFQDLLAWLNQRWTGLDFKTYTVWNREDYGWVEVVTHQPCQDSAAASRFYRRAGQLLCLLHLLGATDCHQENLVAHGEYPVLIDLETLVHPEIKPFLDSTVTGQVDFIAHQQLQRSVFRVGMLPRWEVIADGGAYDISGLGGVGDQPDPFAIPVWQFVNTDQMTLTYQKGEVMPVNPNEVFIGEKSQSPARYVEDLATGFTELYELLRAHQQELLAPTSPLSTFAQQSIRLLFRNSQVYATLLDRSLRPKPLQSGVDHSLEFEPLCLGLLKAEVQPTIWPIVKAECLALEGLDIPHFLANSSQDSLLIGANQQIEHALEGSSLEAVRERLRNLNKNDLAFQLALLRASLALHESRTYAQGSRSTESNQAPEPTLDTIQPLTQEELIQAAEAMAQNLKAQAIIGPDGSVTWLGISYLPQAQRMQLQPLGYSLYEGLPGVALFLAAMARIQSQWKDLALGSLQSLRQALAMATTATDQAQLGSILGLGGAVGLGGILYALVRIGQWLQEPTLWTSAQQAAALVTPDLIGQDTQFDLISGSSGTLLGLLTLYEVDPDPQILKQAIACGDHLLQKRIPGQTAGQAWATVDGRLLSGFSHGAAGIAYALLRLAQMTGEERYRQAAQEAIDYETTLIKGDNWFDWQPDPTSGQMPSVLTSWCHGAPGIGLGRLGGLQCLDTAAIRADIERALRSTRRYPMEANDTLCCGNFGRLDFLFTLAKIYQDLELEAFCQQQVAERVKAAEANLGYRLFPDLQGSLRNPGFWQGMAGIGYQLLRFAEPERFPSVLLWR